MIRCDQSIYYNMQNERNFDVANWHASVQILGIKTCVSSHGTSLYWNHKLEIKKACFTILKHANLNWYWHEAKYNNYMLGKHDEIEA
jgi:hypothetical protein